MMDTTTRHQTMVGGWAVVANACQLECPEEFPQYANQLVEIAVEDLGITRLRLEVRSGAENPVDATQRLFNGEITLEEWEQRRYEIVNDNSDPQVVNSSGFHFTELDLWMDDVVVPIKQRLEARNEEFYLTLTYVDFLESSFEHTSDPEEYAEFISTAVQHLDQKYGLVPDAVEIILEPNNRNNMNWSPQTTGNALVAAANRLQANGYDPDIIAPSHVSMSGAVSFFDSMIEVPGVLDHLTDISYHRYRGVSDQALRNIADRARNNGLRTGMLEHIGSGHEDLIDDLTVANNSTWLQFELADVKDTSDPPGLYLVVDPQTLEVRLSNRARFLSQYFNSIRPGAVRVEATSDDGNLEPVAFINADGRHVVVVDVDHDASATFTVGGLPAGTYEIGYTTADELVRTAEEQTLGTGEVLEVSIPDRGVLSVRQQ